KPNEFVENHPGGPGDFWRRSFDGRLAGQLRRPGTPGKWPLPVLEGKPPGANERPDAGTTRRVEPPAHAGNVAEGFSGASRRKAQADAGTTRGHFQNHCRRPGTES